MPINFAFCRILTGPVAFAKNSCHSLRARYATRPPLQNIADVRYGVSRVRHCIVCLFRYQTPVQSHAFRAHPLFQRRDGRKVSLPRLRREGRLHPKPRPTSPNPSLDATAKGALTQNGADETLQIVAAVCRNLEYFFSLSQRDPRVHGIRNRRGPFHVPSGV